MMHIPSTTTYDLRDGRHIIVGRAANSAVRIRQRLYGHSISIFDQRQPGMLDRLHGDVGLTFSRNAETLAPQGGITWVITHVAMRSPEKAKALVSLELLHRTRKYTFSSPWLDEGVMLALPIDVTVDDPLAIWSGQDTEAIILLQGLVIWPPEAVKGTLAPEYTAREKRLMVERDAALARAEKAEGK